jgi:hypothetical protein
MSGLGDYAKFIFVEIGWAIWTIICCRVEQLIKAMADSGAGSTEMPIDGRRLVRRTGNLRRAGGNQDDGRSTKGCGGRMGRDTCTAWCAGPLHRQSRHIIQMHHRFGGILI